MFKPKEPKISIKLWTNEGDPQSKIEFIKRLRHISKNRK